MKNKILLCFCFVSELILITSVSAKFDSQALAVQLQTLDNSTTGGMLESWKHFPNRKVKKFKNVNDGLSMSINPGIKDFRTKVNTDYENLPLIESEIGYQGRKNENDLSDNFDLPPNRQNLNYLPQLSRSVYREAYPDSYDPMFNQRDIFLRRNFYHSPFYPKTYGIHKPLMYGKRHPNFLLLNQEHNPEKDNVPISEQENTLFSKDIRFPSASNADNNFLSISAMPTSGIPQNIFIKPNERSRVGRDFIKVNNPISNESATDVNGIAAQNTNFNNNGIKTHEMTELNDFDIDKNDTSDSDDLDFLMENENGEKDATPLHMLQIRFERKRDDANDNKKNKLLYNRVYFEKIPHNLNLSWFIYVNCSRERCLLSNSTDESELLNEGWIMHNCSSYGCTEMHPRTASIQKFIGLILLIFSVCVLKIIAFLVLFYYFRRMKLSKKSTDDPEKLDEDSSDSTISEKKSVEKHDNNGEKEAIGAEDFEPTLTNQKNNIISIATVKKEETNSLSAEKTNKENSKLLNQYVAPCLINAGISKNILIPQKKAPDITISSIPKYKKRDRSNIPRLEKWNKVNEKKPASIESQKTACRSDRKISERAEKTSSRDREILLMDLDDEETKDLILPGKRKNTPSWSTLLESESKSFISIDLRSNK